MTSDTRYSRRALFGSLVVGTTAIVLAGHLSAGVSPPLTKKHREKSGYRETEHVRRAYAAARF